MNPDVYELTRTIFLQAVQPGPSYEPVCFATELAKFEAQTEGSQLDAKGLEDALDAEFPWRNHLVYQSHQLQPEESDTWVKVIRWLIQSLLFVDINTKGGARRAQVLLTALGALDVDFEGLNAISEKLSGSHVLKVITPTLQTLRLVPEHLDAQSKEWLIKLSSEVKNGNFKMLQQAQRVLQPQLHSDIQTPIFLLWKLDPEKLAHLIESRDSILFDMLVCIVLDANAPLFALQVKSIPFKFVSVSWLERTKSVRPEINAINVHEKILVQVAKTPYWKGWLQATYEHLTAGAEHYQALAEALTQLAEPQWRDFIFALAPSKSQSSAEYVANILIHVASKLSSAQAQKIWVIAFERWDDWDYGRCERYYYLGSPQVCTFDFPVAKHYSHMPTEKRNALEQDIKHEILHIEQRWFSSESELCTERNRLASRLRLVRHGSALAAGSADTLPAPAQPDSEYAEVRYRWSIS